LTSSALARFTLTRSDAPQIRSAAVPGWPTRWMRAWTQLDIFDISP